MFKFKFLWIKRLFNGGFFGAGGWLSRTWKKAKPFLQTTIPQIIDMVNQWKLIVDSPLPEVLATIFNSKWGFDAVYKARQVMPKVLDELAKVLGIVRIANDAELAKAIMDEIKKMDEEGRHLGYYKVADVLLKFMSDGKLDSAERKVLLETVYQEYLLAKAKGEAA